MPHNYTELADLPEGIGAFLPKVVVTLYFVVYFVCLKICHTCDSIQLARKHSMVFNFHVLFNDWYQNQLPRLIASGSLSRKKQWAGYGVNMTSNAVKIKLLCAM